VRRPIRSRPIKDSGKKQGNKMKDIPKAKVISSVTVLFVETEEGQLTTVLTWQDVRPFETNIVLEQAAHHIMSHVKDVQEVREMRRQRRRPQRQIRSRHDVQQLH
jgi:hypothetical protein